MNSKHSRPKQFAYVLPNLFTAASIFTGFVSMAAAINGQFEKAAWLIFLALIFDGLDGRVARLTNTCSKFGVEFDSLADIVSFGVAPALLIYLYTGIDFGRFGIVASAMFVIFGAIRLARFNIMTAETEPSVFIGIPIPTAAVMISIMVLLFESYTSLQAYSVLILVFSALLALLMVSNIRYPSFKKVNFQPRNMLRLLSFMLVIASLIFIYPIEGFALIFTLYILYGPLRAAVNLFKRSNLIK